MKKGVVTSEVLNVDNLPRRAWAVRASGLPRLLVEAGSPAEAEAKYRERYQLASPLTWAEMEPCQPQRKTSS